MMKHKMITSSPATSQREGHSEFYDNSELRSFKELREFSLELANKIFKESPSENKIFSPLSIFYIFVMLLNGASSPELHARILDYLKIDDADRVNELAINIYEGIFFSQKYYREREEKYGFDENGNRPENLEPKVKLCNSAWVSDKYEVKKDYIDSLVRIYSSIGRVDFGDPETSEEISSWIKEQTQGLISPELNLDKETIIAVINTLFFGEAWSHEFDVDDNEKSVFYTSSGEEKMVEYMTQETWDYYDDYGKVRTLSKDLKDNYELYLVLPDPDYSIEELVNDKEMFSRVLNGGCSKKAEIKIKLPKFDYSNQFDLIEKSEIIGAKQILESPDYYRISDDIPIIDQCLHEAKIKIDEQGVEAAAMTIAVWMCGSAPDFPKDRTEFIFDRPFMFGIRDSAMDTWMFMGICNDPTQHG